MEETDWSTQAPPSPEEFLREINEAEPGWSEKYGGPLGVAALCASLQLQISQISEQIADIRVAGIQEGLKGRSGIEVAAYLGVTPSAISRANKSSGWKDSRW
jgi:hypothetical protein